MLNAFSQFGIGQDYDPELRRIIAMRRDSLLFFMAAAVLAVPGLVFHAGRVE